VHAGALLLALALRHGALHVLVDLLLRRISKSPECVMRQCIARHR